MRPETQLTVSDERIHPSEMNSLVGSSIGCIAETRRRKSAEIPLKRSAHGAKECTICTTSDHFRTPPPVKQNGGERERESRFTFFVHRPPTTSRARYTRYIGRTLTSYILMFKTSRLISPRRSQFQSGAFYLFCRQL